VSGVSSAPGLGIQRVHACAWGSFNGSALSSPARLVAIQWPGGADLAWPGGCTRLYIPDGAMAAVLICDFGECRIWVSTGCPADYYHKWTHS